MSGDKKPAHCYMLHSPKTMAFAGKYKSAGHRYAALKATKKGFEEILLRQTNTKTVHRYTGKVLILDEPRVVKRGDREIVYRKKPVATYHGSYEFSGKLPEEDRSSEPDAQPEECSNEPEIEEPEPAEAEPPVVEPVKPAPKRTTRRKKTG